MEQYDFHGNIPQNEIGKYLREIARIGKDDFKIITGYGSTSGKSKSKEMAMKSLRKMRKEGLIKAFIPAEMFTTLVWAKDEFYEVKMSYKKAVSKDRDATIGNEGVIFVFVR